LRIPLNRSNNPRRSARLSRLVFNHIVTASGGSGGAAAKRSRGGNGGESGGGASGETRSKRAAAPKSGSLLSNIDADLWVGSIVRVRGGGNADGTQAEVLGSGNGWVQLQLRKGTLAKRAHELEVVEANGVKYPPLPRRGGGGGSSSSSGGGRGGGSGGSGVTVGCSVLVLVGEHKGQFGRVESAGFGQYTVRVGSKNPVRLR
jgi:hypothetical protein